MSIKVIVNFAFAASTRKPTNHFIILFLPHRGSAGGTNNKPFSFLITDTVTVLTDAQSDNMAAGRPLKCP